MPWQPRTPSPTEIDEWITAALAEQSAGTDIRPELVKLHESPTTAVFTAAADLCHSDEPLRRIVGCEILRELGQGHSRPYAEQASTLLREMLATEPDPDVIPTILSAIGWQHQRADRDVFIARANDPDPRIREIVASELHVVEHMDDADHDDEVLQIQLRLATDVDEDVRWSAIWTLAEETPLHLPGVIDTLTRVANDPNEREPSVREAREALERH